MLVLPTFPEAHSRPHSRCEHGSDLRTVVNLRPASWLEERLTVRRLVVDEHPQRSLIEAPTLLDHPRGFATYALQHAEVGLVEITQAVDASVEGDRDEVERAEGVEIPFHVWQHKVTVFWRGVTVEDLLGF